MTFIQERKVQLLIQNAQLLQKYFFQQMFRYMIKFESGSVAKYLYTESELTDHLEFFIMKCRVPGNTDQMPYKFYKDKYA